MLTTKKRPAGPGAINKPSPAYLSAFSRLYGEQKGRFDCKPLPPFGRTISEAIANGLRPRNDIRIYVGGDAMTRARADIGNVDRISMALLSADDPARYRWPVAGAGVVVFLQEQIPGERVQWLALELFKGGATVVRVVHTTGRLTVYRQGGER